MVKVEERLDEMFTYLPAMAGINSEGSFNPTFGYGDGIELNAFLKGKQNSESPYPLIWLLYPYSEQHSEHFVDVKGMVLVLAVQSNASMQNRERLKTTFNQLLIPLYDNISLLFKRASITNLNWDYEVQKHPNYSDGGDSAGTFLWDALRMKFDIRITDDCLKAIKV